MLSKVTNDVDTIAQTLNNSVGSLISSVTLLFGALAMMFVTNWQMALAAIGASFVGFILMMLIMGRSKYFLSQQNDLGTINGHIGNIFRTPRLSKHTMVRKKLKRPLMR